MPKARVLKLDDAILQQFPPGARYLIGLSGGRDSIALLHALRAAGYHNLVVCHLDHELRGRHSRADAHFVENLAKTLRLPAEIGTSDVRALAQKAKLSLETAARVARYAFFIGVARQRRCRTIFLAHHADDLAETALLNLFRGASPGGLASLRPVTSHRIGKTELTVVRPLLGIWRREIDAYVKQHDLKFREDATNARVGSRRNRIRHRILPYIEKQLGRDVRTSIWRAAQIWLEEELLLDSLLEEEIERELRIASLRALPVALQRRQLHRWLREHEIGEVSFDLIEKIRALLAPQAPTAKINLARNRHLRRRAGKLFIE
ncbi:MAG: tRNA lysidine(34) synthetase TilS [Verrucomicrobiota bacterium]|nr:tRNA lysidine(34) synthetase TilS [Verrucomicrobiota bacterium]